MKLSKAIRLGAMVKPQAFGVTLTEDGRTCALGAALDAIGQLSRCHTAAFYHWPICSQYVQLPVTGESVALLSAIRELNDGYKWTRERIADWVETVEVQLMASTLVSEKATT